ncbi:MAG: sigma-54 interaction domain-containing protein, partial [Bryobacteraceae bacterium]
VASYDLAVAIFPLPEWAAEDFVVEVKRIAAAVSVFVCDPAGQLADAIRLTKLGADYFFAGRLDPEEVGQQMDVLDERRRSRSLRALASAILDEPWRQLLVGRSRAMEDVCRMIRLIGSKRCTVMVTGETGTGKERVARALHLAGPRAHLPMVAVNCSAIPETLLEAELFGHVKGAFTGAMYHRVGRFEQAHRGTIFLDEIGDLPLDLQAKLLRVLQEREFQRVGSSESVRVDVRVVAASNVDLVEHVRQGRFREDLYYRLNVVPIRTPPLRDRVDDIPHLVDHFLEKVCGLEEIAIKEVTPRAIDHLSSYSWPGNVRQLENAVEMAVALSGDRRVLEPADFPLAAAGQPPPVSSSLFIQVPEDGLDFERIVGDIERSILSQALDRTGGNKKQAADLLRLKRTTLAAKLKSLGAGA